MATHYYYETIENLKIVSLDVKDVRFPTSLGLHGSDAMHRDPDFSCAYVTIRLASGTTGNGFTFTCGRGNEIVVAAIKSLSFLVVGATVVDIYKDFAAFSRSLTNETQLRWLGPEKGVTHLATAAILNALWDLWAKLLKKPVWRLLVDLPPEQLVSTIDFKYIKDVITKEEAIEILRKAQDKKEERIKKITADGYPAYTSQNGWIGYSKETLIELTEKYNDLGFNHFKIKVGLNLDDDIRRLKIVRNIIGWDKKLSIDANQVWDVEEAIPWVKKLAGFKLTWVEEPTSPDDILGHATISKELNPLGIGVASGEMCSNKVLFKEFLLTDAIQYVQVDPARLAGINEILAVYLMAHKKGVKVVPHGGALGLGEMIQHLQIWDYVSLSGTTEDRYVEYIDLQHEHFVNPVSVKNGRYEVPTTPGYSTTLKDDSILKYEYPVGTEWESMFSKGLFHDPRKAPSRRTSAIKL
ncbi:mitochondrial enolase superfamily member 1 [Agrilus planipennis]|uniref:Mitochondrial enolase superfamily member 1 n=1 Tax=Agrilus planipennis TaxID=224129 RepID=A0A1W4X5J5_AGRPL|nr:mitochondrial enolase superfamily member 1 [Agrilus planipennis]